MILTQTPLWNATTVALSQIHSQQCYTCTFRHKQKEKLSLGTWRGGVREVGTRRVGWQRGSGHGTQESSSANRACLTTPSVKSSTEISLQPAHTQHASCPLKLSSLIFFLSVCFLHFHAPVQWFYCFYSRSLIFLNRAQKRRMWERLRPADVLSGHCCIGNTPYNSWACIWDFM